MAFRNDRDALDGGILVYAKQNKTYIHRDDLKKVRLDNIEIRVEWRRILVGGIELLECQIRNVYNLWITCQILLLQVQKKIQII